jgi:hypothetical protein
MKRFFAILLFLLTIFFSFSFAETDIEININISENYSTYFIIWNITPSYGYYYPYGSEFKIKLPKNFEIINISDSEGEARFFIENSTLHLFTSRNIYYPNIYKFYIKFKEINNPVSCDNEFYFRSYFSPMDFSLLRINLPDFAQNIFLKKEKNYVKIYNRSLTFYGNGYGHISLIFSKKDGEDEKILINFKNFDLEIPKKYENEIYTIAKNIDEKAIPLLEEIFNKKINKTLIKFVSQPKENWICYFQNNSIYCGIGILLDYENVAENIIHEFTHYFMSQTIGNGLPPWFEEGIAEKLGYEISNLIGYKKDVDFSIINECKKYLNYQFWRDWECERFGCEDFSFLNSTSDNECAKKYGIDSIRYIFSFYVVNKSIDNNFIKFLSSFMQKNNLKIESNAKNKNSILVLLLDLFQVKKDLFKEFKMIEDETDFLPYFRKFEDTKNKIEEIKNLSDFDFYEKPREILQYSLYLLFNGELEEFERYINNSGELAENIFNNSIKIKEEMMKINISLTCFHDFSLSLIEEAYRSYSSGNFEESIKYLEKATLEKSATDKRIKEFKKTFEKIKENLFSNVFSNDLKEIENYILECNLDKAEKKLYEIDRKIKNLEISLFALVITFLIFIFVKYYWSK